MEVKTKKLARGGYEYVLDVPGFSDLKYKHGSLIVRPEVVSQVIEVLVAD
ncbi:MAG: hypothetical protein FJ044_03805 [Candidatus Cloacimonetes bacterium]|nr:hypothetical protein [Candidatus Cloacimonadota bacterium]